MRYEVEESLHAPAIHNPHLLSRDELCSLFTARKGLLRMILEDLPVGDGCQHHLLVGQRGMGKTMMLRRLQAAVEDHPLLGTQYFPVAFPEEQYDVAHLSDFWFNCLEALGEYLESQGYEPLAEVEQAQNLVLREKERRHEVLSLLTRVASRYGRRILLLVDNLDLILDRLSEIEEWSLRETLSADDRLLLIGTSTTVTEALTDHRRALFCFFHVHELAGLSLADTEAVLEGHANHWQVPEVREILEKDPGRVRALHGLTGGNPRALTLLYTALARAPQRHLPRLGGSGGVSFQEGDVRADLEQLLDHFTPLYKARIETLPPQAQQVFHRLALNWDPATAATLAEEIGLPVNTVSTQLGRLCKLGMVEKVPYDPPSKAGFQVGERFFNVWYLMRAGRRERRRLIALVEFLRRFYQGETSEPALAHTVAEPIAGRSFILRDAQAAEDRSWPEILALYRQEVLDGRAREAAEILDEVGLAERWRPLREALEILALDHPAYLLRLAPEVREPVKEILTQLTSNLPTD